MPRRQAMAALVVALIASVLTYVYISSAAETGEVVLASADIPQGTLVTAQALRVARIPAACIHPSAFRDVKEVVGRYASERIVSGEQVLEERIASGRDAWPTSGLAADLRAIFVPVAAPNAVGGAVRAGERVDVIFVSQADRLGAAAKRLLRSVPVIAASFGDEGGRVRSQAGAARALPWSGEGVLLAVTPGDAERLAFCIENGQVYLAAVPYDADPVHTPGVTWSELFGGDAAGDAQAPGR